MRTHPHPRRRDLSHQTLAVLPVTGGFGVLCVCVGSPRGWLSQLYHPVLQPWASDMAFSADQALSSVLQDRRTVSAVGWALWAGRARTPGAPCPHQLSVCRLHDCGQGLLPLETDLSVFLPDGGEFVRNRKIRTTVFNPKSERAFKSSDHRRAHAFLLLWVRVQFLGVSLLVRKRGTDHLSSCFM